MDEKLTEALDEVRDEYIAEAASSKRKRRWVFLPAIAAVLAVVIFFASFADIWMLEARAISQADYSKHSEVDYKDARTLIGQLQPFLEKSMTRILSQAGQENLSYSPINLYMAMAVSAELSGGNEQLLELLDADSLDALRTQAKLVWNASYRDRNGKEKTHLANSVWLREDMAYDKAILDTLAENYFTSSYRANFGTAATNRDIAAWLDEQTGSILKQQTAQINLSPETAFAMYATVFYQAKWVQAFSAIQNTNGIFHGTRDANCSFMNKYEMIGLYYWGEDFGAVSLSLKDGGQMWLILPDADKTVADVVAAGEYLQTLVGNTENQKAMKINLSLPKFDITSSGDLKKDLQAMGVTEIFDPQAGCFEAFMQSDTPVWIQAVNQATRVAVDEEGVTAASYIEFPGAMSPEPPDEIIDFILDRPFLFVVTNRYDLPLFAGVVNDVS